MEYYFYDEKEFKESIYKNEGSSSFYSNDYTLSMLYRIGIPNMSLSEDDLSNYILIYKEYYRYISYMAFNIRNLVIKEIVYIAEK